MNDEEREQWLAESRAQSDALRQDIEARRLRRERGDEDREWRCPPVPARAAEAPTLEYRETADALVHTERQVTAVLDPEILVGIGEALGMVRKQMRDHADKAVAELKAQVVELTRTVENLQNELTLLRVTKATTSRQPTGPRTRSTNGEIHVARRN